MGDHDRERRQSAADRDRDEAATPVHCPDCGETLDLGRGRYLSLRHSERDDAGGLQDLYRRLRPDDLRRRFFTGGLPPPQFFDRWATIAERGGFGLVAELSEPAGRRLVGEAAYAPTIDGRADGEIGIAVDPSFRGWLGPWLLDALVRHARRRGVENLQALVLVENRAMLALVQKRGYATLDHPDWNTVRVVFATDGSVPTWGHAHEHPRVLVETDRSRWRGEDELAEAGFDVMLCNGLYREGSDCPVLHGETCPLIGGADAVVVDLPDDDLAASLVHSEELLHPGVRFVAARDGDVRRGAADVVAELTELLDAGDEPDPGDVSEADIDAGDEPDPGDVSEADIDAGDEPDAGGPA